MTHDLKQKSSFFKGLSVYSLLFAVILLITASSCMKVGPDYKRPEFGFDMPQSYQHDDKQESLHVEIKDVWWETFGDPQINDLVAYALAYNLDIQKTAAVILEFQGRLTQARADRFPSFNAAFQAKRNQINTETTFLSGISPGGKLEFDTKKVRVTTNSYGLSLPATYELDLWGRLARANEAARANLLLVEENRKTIIQGILAEVISLYLEMESPWLSVSESSNSGCMTAAA